MGYEAAVKELFEEEEKEGWMRNMKDEEANKEFGDRLHVAALGVVVEKGKFRVTHDGTHRVLVNHRIRSWTRSVLRRRGRSGR